MFTRHERRAAAGDMDALPPPPIRLKSKLCLFEYLRRLFCASTNHHHHRRPRPQPTRRACVCGRATVVATREVAVIERIIINNAYFLRVYNIYARRTRLSLARKPRKAPPPSHWSSISSRSLTQSNDIQKINKGQTNAGGHRESDNPSPTRNDKKRYRPRIGLYYFGYSIIDVFAQQIGIYFVVPIWKNR